MYREFIKLHDPNDPIVQNEVDLLDSLVLKCAWAEAGIFLKNDRATFFALCEGLPSQSWHRCLVQNFLSLSLQRSPEAFR